MTVAERVLLSMSRRSDSPDYMTEYDNPDVGGALTLLCESFPDFLNTVAGKTVVDYGCGAGYQSIALTLNGARHVLGVDIDLNGLEKARQLSVRHGVKERLRFASRVEDRYKGTFDIMIS